MFLYLNFRYSSVSFKKRINVAASDEFLTTKLSQTHNINLTRIPLIPQCGKYLKFLKSK